MSGNTLDDFLSDPQAFEALPEDHQAHLLEHGKLPEAAAAHAPEPEAASVAEAPQADNSAAQPSAEEATPDQETQEPAKKGDPEVPLRAERQKNRQLQAQLEAHQQALLQHQAVLNNPQVLQQLLAQHAPAEKADFLTDPDKFVQQAVQQATAPLVQTIQHLQAQNQMQVQQTRMQMLQQKYPDLAETLQHVDTNAPDLQRQFPDPEARYLLAKGAQAADPATQQQMIQAQAQKLAEQMTQQALQKAASNGGKTIPATLGGVPQAKVQAPRSIDDVGFEEFSKMSPEDRKKLAPDL